MSERPTIKDAPLTCEDCLETSIDVRPKTDPYMFEFSGQVIEIIVCPICYLDRCNESF